MSAGRIQNVTNLDAQSADEILAIVERLNREFKKTVVMVTHDPRAAYHASITRTFR